LDQDQHTYRRAASAALIGLIAQVLLYLAVGIISVYADAPSMTIATWHLFGGIPIWIVLWLLMNQHRIERVEALEEQQLAARGARSAAMFEGGEQLRDSQQRLKTLYRWGLPIVSIGLVIYLAALGSWFLYANRNVFAGELLEANLIRPDARISFLAFFFVGAAFISFLVARYVAGMTQVEAWQPLRGGAGYMMGSTVVLGLLAAACLTRLFGNPVVFAVLQVVLPGLMILLAVEFLLNLLLGLYRPRKGAEVVRPAFDSRLLGWLTRPESIGEIISETINYQFGFEISRSWFYQLLSRAFVPLCAVAGLVLLGLSSIVVVAPQQQAVITTFGHFDRVVEPGLALKWPWPIGQVTKFDAYRVHQIVIGSRLMGEEKLDDRAILWTNQHTEGEEKFLVTASTAGGGEAGGDDIAAGELIGGDVVVKYRIDDLATYVNAADDPKAMLIALSEREVNRYVATKLVDELLGGVRSTAGEELHRRIQASVDRHGLGIEIVFVSVSGLHPPQNDEVAAAFHEVIDAVQEKQVAIENAQKDAVEVLARTAGTAERARRISAMIEKLSAMRSKLEAMDENEREKRSSLQQQILEQTVAIEDAITLADATAEGRSFGEAGGEAAQKVLEARAYRWSRAIEELAAAERFGAELYAYEQAPQYYKARLELDALARILEGRRKIILDTTLDPTIRLELLNEPDLGSDLGINPR